MGDQRMMEYPIKSLVLAKMYDHSNGSYEWRRAEIIDKRAQEIFESPNNAKRSRELSIPPSPISPNPPESARDAPLDFYVHYIKYNRRLDCWLPYVDLYPIDPPVQPEEKRERRERGDRSERDRGEDKREYYLPPLVDNNGTPLNLETLLKEIMEEENDLVDSENEHEGLDKNLLEHHKIITKVKTINRIQLGRYLIDTWYYSPYPAKFQTNNTLYICNFCLSFFQYESELKFHYRKCALKNPPGDEIYRHENISVFEVDGYMARTWCENLCYLSKLFLDHKTLEFDTDTFLFYILTEYDADNNSYDLVGYFSKEKFSRDNFNLACILVLPNHQKKGYGNFLISFSYELTIKENKTGSPEKPLSDLGRLSYRSYWIKKLLSEIDKRNSSSVSLTELSNCTGICIHDVKNTLEEFNILKYIHGNYVIIINQDIKNKILQPSGGGEEKKMEERKGEEGKEVRKRKNPIVLPENIRWVPFLLSSNKGLHFTSAKGMNILKEDSSSALFGERERSERERERGEKRGSLITNGAMGNDYLMYNS